MHYPSAGAELIFSLPNGLFAFALAGADGRRLDALPCTSDVPCAGQIRALNSVTCRACHGDQPVSVLDEVLPYLDADPTRYAPDLVPLIREQYPADLWRALEADQARASAANEAATRGDGGSIVGTYYNFTSRPLDALAAANDLGVAVEEMRAAIAALSASLPELAPLLTDCKIERDLFTFHYSAIACAVEGPRNIPARCP